MFDSKNTITNLDLAQELLKRGVYEFQLGNYSNALAIITQAIEVKPNYYEALVVRASLIYPLFNNYQGIIQDWTKVLKINPANHEAYNNRGYTFSLIGAHTEAIKDYTFALMIDNGSAVTYLNRGISFHHIDECKKAISDFNSVIEIDSCNADAFNNRGLVYTSLQENCRAIYDFDIALKLNPNHVKAYLNRGVCRLKMSDIFVGVQDFNIALKIDSKTAKEYFHYFKQALIDIQNQQHYKEKNNFKQSVEDLIDKAIELSDVGDNKEAIKYFSLALNIEPKNAEIYNNRGYCFYLLSDFDKALEDYSSALEIDPKFLK